MARSVVVVEVNGYTILAKADLFRANLVGADLRGVNLRRAGLTGTDLTGADLTGADLAEADLTKAKLTGTTLVDLSYNEKTIWPRGFTPPPTTTRPPPMTTRPPPTTTRPPPTTRGLVAVDFWPVVDETTCVSRGTGVMRCLVGIGDYAGQSVDCLSVGIMGWRCIAYVPD